MTLPETFLRAENRPAFAIRRTLAIVVSFSRQKNLCQVSPADPMAVGGTALLLVSVALLASYIPARRATRVDPMIALRNQ